MYKDHEDLMYSSEYAEYIMEHGKGDRAICNSKTLTQAMEDGYLWKEFIEFYIAKQKDKNVKST